MIVWRDGAWIENPEHADDRGAHLGDGLFESILWSAGRAVRLERHLSRLKTSAKALALACPDLAGVESMIGNLARANALANARAAINLSLRVHGPRGLDRSGARTSLAARIAAAPADDARLTLTTVSIRRNETAPSARHKTLSYFDQIEARREARGRGADEAAQLNSAGALACAAAGNLVLVIDGAVLTPRVADGALPGTVRAELLARGLAAEATITTEALQRAEAAAVTNAILGVRAVARWDGRALGDDHPAIEALAAAIAA